MHRGRKRSEQAQVLRSSLLGRLAIWIAAWSAFCLGAFTLLQAFVSPTVGDAIAESTSSWVYYDDMEDLRDYLERHPDAQIHDMVIAVDDSLEAESAYTGEEGRVESLQIAEEGADGEVAVKEYRIEGKYAARDLSFYYFVRSLKVPVAMVVYFVGLAFLVVLTLNRSLRYFDDLANAIHDPGLLDGDAIRLPPELSIASQQLEKLQANVEEHERSATAAERRKNELVAYIAHDIRTPLTSVIGYLDLLVESPDLPAEKRAAYSGIALDKANKLESLVNEFFEITRYNLGSIGVEREKVDTQLFLQQVAEEFGLAAQGRKVGIRVDAPEGLEAFIDPSKMARAVGNVLKNAVAYADSGTEARLSAKEFHGRLVIEVSNRGKGISKEHLDHVFEQFFREDSSRSQEGNAGLGLAIAKEVVEAHGGDISASSENGLTIFTIWVPSTPSSE